jgi:tetratricopeptide (TPR) repeat protein
MQFKGKNRPPTPDIAGKLNVDAVVEGSVSRSGDKVRITAQLIDARADKHLWANTFERHSRDVLALQAELASAIAREVNVRLTSNEQDRLAAAPSVNPEAHDAYLKGRYFFNRPSDENLQKAIAQFEEAVRLSPAFAPAFSGMSDAYLWAGYNEGFLTATEARPKAKSAAEKAVQLGDNSAEAHTSLAVFKLFLRIRPGRVRARIPACVRAQPQLRVRARSVRHGAGVPGTVSGSDRRGHTRDRTGSTVAAGARRCVRRVHVPTEFGGGQETRTAGSGARSDILLPRHDRRMADLEMGKFREAIPALKKAKAMEAPPFVTAYLAFAYGAAGDRAAALASWPI